MELRETASGIVVDVYVKPRSKQFRLELAEDEIAVSCQEAPVKSRANRELVKELSKLFKLKVEILSDFSARAYHKRHKRWSTDIE